jgi:hypothetical protein
MNFKHLFTAFASVSLIALPSAAGAHGSMKPSHGGVVTMSGETMVELVRTAKGADIYISEEDQPLAASGYTGTATVTASGAKKSFPLTAQAGNKMTAPGLKAPAGSKVVVALTSKKSEAKTFATFMMK